MADSRRVIVEPLIELRLPGAEWTCVCGKSSWRLMLAVNVAVVIGVFFYKLARPPYVPYIHLLVDYHFGFTKRALIGAIVSLFAAKVPVWLVFALAGGVWLVTLWLFIVLFRRTFGPGEPHLPLFVFMAGSPFFLKNFMHTLGHFDIYGCAFALGLMLVPARSVAFVVLAALAAMILILIHHIHLLMYVPTIAVIVALRHYLVAGLNRSNLLIGAASVLGVGLLFAAAQFYGTVRCRRRCSCTICRAAWPTPREPICWLSATSGTSRWPRRFTTPGSACLRTCSAFPCTRCCSGCMRRCGAILPHRFVRSRSSGIAASWSPRC